MSEMLPTPEENLALEEEFAALERRRQEWCLLGIDLKTGDRTYSCRACHAQRITLVTPGVKLPERCPKCGAEQRAPSLDDPAERQCAAALKKMGRKNT